MVALVWVDEDEQVWVDEDERVLVAQAEGLVGGPQAGVTRAVRRGRQRYFWRRMLAVWLVAVLGALTWNATERLFSSTGAATGALGCGYTALQPQTIALASAGATSLRAAAPLPELGFNDKGTTSCSHIYVARPGDTIWQIAVRFSGGGDPRPLADSLEAEIGGGALQPGQPLNVP